MFGHKIKFLLIILAFIACLLACGDVSNSKSNPDFESALPHSDALPNKAGLSDADKQKLSSAKGKSVEEIQVSDIEQMFDAAQDKLHIFSFWQLNCKDCLEMNAHLEKISHEVVDDKLKVIFINVDDIADKAKINTYIRSKSITNEAYILKNKKEGWADGLHEDWDGKLPALFLVNETEGIILFVQRSLKKDELMRMIETLAL